LNTIFITLLFYKAYGSGTHTASSCRHHSIPTLYSTQVSQINSFGRIRNDNSIPEGIKLPILQEAAAVQEN